MFIIKNYLKKIAQSAVISVILLSLTGCATIAGDNTRTVCVNSHPQGAGIYIEGQRHGTTPANITLSNYIYNGKTVTLKKDGYYDQTMTINSKFQPCSLWNLILCPGFLIDAATGNIVKINPAQLNMTTDLQIVGSENSK
jgi:hypothetical protein